MERTPRGSDGPCDPIPFLFPLQTGLPVSLGLLPLTRPPRSQDLPYITSLGRRHIQ